MLRPRAALILAVCLTVAPPIAAEDNELERLLDIADEGFVPIYRPLDRPAFYHAKALSVTEDSLASGWVRNHQCHRHFSTTSLLEIVFPRGKIRNIAITDSSNLGDIEVRGHAIQLKDVNEKSTLCFDSENHVLQREPDGSYRITAGPFYYRFLDGYFPIEVNLKVQYPPSLLKVLSVVPANRRGVEITRKDGEVRLWSRFKGTLWTHIIFERR